MEGANNNATPLVSETILAGISSFFPGPIFNGRWDAISREVVNQHKEQIFASKSSETPNDIVDWAYKCLKIYQIHQRHAGWMLECHIAELRRYHYCVHPSTPWYPHFLAVKIRLLEGGRDPRIKFKFLKISRLHLSRDSVTVLDDWPSGDGVTEDTDDKIDFELKRSWCPDFLALCVLMMQEIPRVDQPNKEDSWYATVIRQALDKLSNSTGGNFEVRKRPATNSDGTNAMVLSSSPESPVLELDEIVTKVLQGYQTNRLEVTTQKEYNRPIR